MELYFARTKETKRMEFEGALNDLLKQTAINKETVIVIRNDTIITEEDKITNKDKLTIIPIISGG